MRLLICDARGESVLAVEEAKPECGKHFCDTCGDCLAYHEDEECPESPDGHHVWVRYEKESPPPPDPVVQVSAQISAATGVPLGYVVNALRYGMDTLGHQRSARQLQELLTTGGVASPAAEAQKE